MKKGSHISEYSYNGLWKKAEDGVDFKVQTHLLRHAASKKSSIQLAA